MIAQRRRLCSTDRSPYLRSVSPTDAMPHASDSRRIEYPFGATDEVKVYKDEGEDEKPENLSEEKFGLVTETEEVKFKIVCR